MASYLADRKEFVNVNSEKSNLQLVKRVVSQGSIRRPLLFLVYIHDIGSNANTIGKLLLYADDTVFIENSFLENGGLNYLETWLALNKVDLNYMKSNFVFFEKRAKVYGNIEIDGEIIAASNWEFISIKSWILIYIFEELSRSFRNNSVLSVNLEKHWTHLT